MPRSNLPEPDSVPLAKDRALDQKPSKSKLLEQTIRHEEDLRAKIRKEIAEEESKGKQGGFRSFVTSQSFYTTLLTAIVIPLLVWLVGQIGVAWKRADADKIEAQGRADAEKAQRLADRRADITQMTPLIPHFAQTGDERVRLVALRVLGALREARADDTAIRSVYQAAEQQAADLEASGTPAEQAEGRRIREALAPPTSGTRATTPPPLGSPVTPAAAQASRATPKRVYIQIYDENQREAANALRDALRARNVLVPGIENVVRTQGASVRRFAQLGAIGVRYYHESDRPAAIFTAGVAQGAAPGGAPRLQNLSNRSSPAAEGVVEIWFPCGTAQGCSPPAPAPPRSPAS